jgi:glycosyltransferase involved in cell wall biosynthesis
MNPLISCLMVTRDRPALVERAIASYCRQGYEPRELVIIAEGDEAARAQLFGQVQGLGRADIRVLFVDGEPRPLGALRNLSLDAAAGELVCQWDDDDYSHPERLAVQAAALLRAGAQASFLSDHLQLFEADRTLHWIDWRSHGRDGMGAIHPGTLLMRKDPRFRYPERGDYARMGEDSVLLAALYQQSKVTILSGMGYLYLYAYHGRNTFSEQHHRRIALESLSLADLRQREADLRQALGSYPLPPGCRVMGREGLAWTVE